MDLLSYYGLFLAKTVTIVVAIVAIAVVIANLALRKRAQSGQLKLTHLDERYTEMQDTMRLAKMKPLQQKLWHKEQKKKRSWRQKPPNSRRNWDVPRKRRSPHCM